MIDLGFDYIEEGSPAHKAIQEELARGDENGIYIGNCYYTHEMIKEDAEKRRKEKNK